MGDKLAEIQQPSVRRTHAGISDHGRAESRPAGVGCGLVPGIAHITVPSIFRRRPIRVMHWLTCRRPVMLVLGPLRLSVDALAGAVKRRRRVVCLTSSFHRESAARHH